MSKSDSAFIPQAPFRVPTSSFAAAKCQPRINGKTHYSFYRGKSNASLKLPIRSSLTHETGNLAVDKSFEAWLKESSIYMDGIEILAGSFPHTNIEDSEVERGLYATKDIEYGGSILSFCKESIISVNMEEGEENFEMIHLEKPQKERLWKYSAWYFRLAMKLMDEKLKGEASKFSCYIKTLPMNPKSAIWFIIHEDTKEMTKRLLQKYGMWETSLVFMKNVNRVYRLLKSDTSTKNPISYELFVWAVCICINRAFALPLSSQHREIPEPIEFGLIPGLDMANHCIASNSKLKYDGQNDRYHVYSGMNTHKGDQVFVSYGAKHNDELAFFYGFVEGRNPGNKVIIYNLHDFLSNLMPSETEKRWDIFNLSELTKEDVQIGIRSDAIDEDLMKILRVVHMTDEEIIQMHDDLTTKKECRVKLGKHISLENEIAVWNTLIQWCEEMIADLNENDLTQIEHQHETTGSGVFSAIWDWRFENSEGELVYQWERKRILRETIDRLNHHKKISMAIGTVCTVLLPPSQSVLRTEIYDKNDSGGDASNEGDQYGRGAGLRMFDVIHNDIQKTIEESS